MTSSMAATKTGTSHRLTSSMATATAVPHGNKDDESGFISPVDAICSLNHSPCVLRSLIDLMATAVGGYCMAKGQQECTCSTERDVLEKYAAYMRLCGSATVPVL